MYWYKGYDETGFERIIGLRDDLETAMRLYEDDLAEPYYSGGGVHKVVGCTITNLKTGEVICLGKLHGDPEWEPPIDDTDKRPYAEAEEKTSQLESYKFEFVGEADTGDEASQLCLKDGTPIAYYAAGGPDPQSGRYRVGIRYLIDKEKIPVEVRFFAYRYCLPFAAQNGDRYIRADMLPLYYSEQLMWYIESPDNRAYIGHEVLEFMDHNG